MTDDGAPCAFRGRRGALSTTTARITMSASRRCSALLDQGKIMTWADWFKAGNVWTRRDLQDPGYDPKANPNLPSTETIAQALNNLAAPAVRQANHTLISKAAIGAIAGRHHRARTNTGSSRIRRTRVRVPVAFDGRHRRPHGDRLGGVRASPGPCRSASIRSSRQNSIMPARRSISLRSATPAPSSRCSTPASARTTARPRAAAASCRRPPAAAIAAQRHGHPRGGNLSAGFGRSSAACGVP